MRWGRPKKIRHTGIDGDVDLRESRIIIWFVDGIDRLDGDRLVADVALLFLIVKANLHIRRWGTGCGGRWGVGNWRGMGQRIVLAVEGLDIAIDDEVGGSTGMDAVWQS